MTDTAARPRGLPAHLVDFVHALRHHHVDVGPGETVDAAAVLAELDLLRRDQLRDTTGDPWGGRTLEWATSSPPPDYNFAFTPVIHDHDAWWDMKKRGYARPLQGFKAIHMPKSTAAGIILGVLSIVFAFAMIWYIWWLAAFSFAAIAVVAIGHTFNYNRDFYIPADEVVRTEGQRTALLAERV